MSETITDADGQVWTDQRMKQPVHLRAEIKDSKDPSLVYDCEIRCSSHSNAEWSWTVKQVFNEAEKAEELKSGAYGRGTSQGVCQRNVHEAIRFLGNSRR